MAHFAKLGANSKVIQVLTLDNKDMLNADAVSYTHLTLPTKRIV